ncbi:MAG: sugar ABC transporter permease [Clostridia bacterium]
MTQATGLRRIQARERGKRLLVPLLFILPAFVYHACLVVLPALSTIYMSFFDWNGLGAGTFVGFANFVEIFTKDTVFPVAILNNLKWLLVFMVLPTTIGLLVAILVSRQKKGQLLYRAIYFLPYVLASIVAGKIWSSLLSPYFGIGKMCKVLGLTELGRVQWLGNPDLALFTVAFVDNWHYWGFVMVLFIAALHQVDNHLYEAARVEGASKWSEFWHVTIPGIMPTLVFIIMTTMMWSFTTFDYIWAMTKGGPGQSTEILSTWIYKNAFMNYRGGYANALCVVQLGFVVLVFLLQQRLRKKAEEF